MEELSLFVSFTIRLTGGPGVSAIRPQLFTINIHLVIFITSVYLPDHLDKVPTENFDADGVHLHTSRALQAENVFASIVSVYVLHHHRCLGIARLDNDALAVFNVGVHLCPYDLWSGAALDGCMQPHSGAST